MWTIRSRVMKIPEISARIVMSSDDSDSWTEWWCRLRKGDHRFPAFVPTFSIESSGSFGQSTIPDIPESSEVHGSASSDELTRPQTSIATSLNSAELRGENVPVE
jgi:hypothetical protein